MHQKSVCVAWVRIPAPSTGWTFFSLICCKNELMFHRKRPKINEKEAGGGPFKIRSKKFIENTITKTLLKITVQVLCIKNLSVCVAFENERERERVHELDNHGPLMV